jgi:hypothetical protein
MDALQLAIVVLIVGCAIAYAALRLRRTLRRDDPCCGCTGCEGCVGMKKQDCEKKCSEKFCCSK